ncbi:MAG: amino acid ABC transporter permease [Candidatus Eremiobacteraeota bacterium]|nr:amino acid ABC transporter permease [Candidatus Eremiobacteraeota bacterium]
MGSYLVALPSLARGLATTFLVSTSAMILAVAIGFVFGIVRSQVPRAVDAPILALVEFFRGIPLLVLMYFLFFGLPQLGIRTSSNVAAIVALALYAGSLGSEIVRGAIASIPRGQSEAASALGLDRAQLLLLVLLPQALRRMLPPFVGLFALIVESSSLASLIDVTDLLQVAHQNVERDNDVALPVYLTVLVAYFIINYPISLVSQRLEKRLT